jgi:ribonuclease Z
MRCAIHCSRGGSTRSACLKAGRSALAHGRLVALADGRRIAPEMVHGPIVAGAKLAIIGDTEEVASLVEPVRGADVLVIEATFLERDAALARSRGHLTATTADSLAREAAIGELLLTAGTSLMTSPPKPPASSQR